jgi:signal transduction histidine kinase/DNA-binding response OmpR family regulator
MILIVDDKPENIFSLKTLLEINKFDVDTALSGEEALKKILKFPYFLIILDVQMPGMDGFEVAEAISGYSKVKDIPIIFLSAVNTDKKFITKGYTSGGMDYVAKPIDPDLLLLKVKTFYKIYSQKNELDKIQQILRKEIEYRKQTELKLHQNVGELRSILESIPQIAFTADAIGNIEFVNNRWYNYSADKDILPISHIEDTPVAHALKQAIASGEQLEVESRIQALSTGNYRYHLLSITPVKEQSKIVKWVGIFTDIHLQRMANQVLEQRVNERTNALLQTNALLEARNTELEQFAFITSHDLTEPLRKVQVFSHMVKSKFAIDKSAEAMPYLDRIIASSERVSGLINDLLSYSKLDTAELKEPTDINQLIEDIRNDLDLLISDKGAILEHTAIPKLQVNPIQMRLLLQNLVTNSLKFSKNDRKPHIQISAETVIHRNFDSPLCNNGQFCRISVTDNGIGFNEQYVEKIFVLFQRLNPKESYPGTGMGLAIVKKIVDGHHGIITARSKEGEGTTFIIVLPISQSEKITLD